MDLLFLVNSYKKNARRGWGVIAVGVAFDAVSLKCVPLCGCDAGIELDVV